MAGEKNFVALDNDEVKIEIGKLSELIKQEWLNQERKRLQQEILQAERDKNTDKLTELMQEFQQLNI